MSWVDLGGDSKKQEKKNRDFNRKGEKGKIIKKKKLKRD